MLGAEQEVQLRETTMTRMARKTADGKTAIRVREHAGNTWLIRTRTTTYLTEIRPNLAVENFDDSAWQGINDEPTSWAPARAWRLYADEMDAEMRRNGVQPGWYVDFSTTGSSIGPFIRRDEAEKALRYYAENDMGQYFAPAKNVPVKTPSGKTAEPVVEAENYWIIRSDQDALALVHADDINDPATYTHVAAANRYYDPELGKKSWIIRDRALWGNKDRSMPYIKDTKEILAGCAMRHASREA